MIELAKPGKYSLSISNPVMIASGMMGFDPSTYRNLMKLEKLGAIVTAGLSWKARGPAKGARVVPSPGGLLLHTGLPNPGVTRVIQKYGQAWANSPIPIIVHIIANRPEEAARCAEVLEGVANVVGIELGLHDQVHPDDIPVLIAAIQERSQLPLLIKLPLYGAPFLSQAAEDGGADGLVVAGPPRGTDRDLVSGQLIGGRMYGPWLKPQVLRAVGQIAELVSIPVIACGGIHTADDARDYLAAGARAVQVDTLVWTQPSEVEIIARNIGGEEVTRAVGALADEWQPGLGKTQMIKRNTPAPVPEPPPLPPQQRPNIGLPEFPLGENDRTEPSDPFNDDSEF
jgi:dihydroorotate dehydrogenase (NAD+) catalytic subunit